MKQLTLRDIIDMVNILVNEKSIHPEEVMDLPIYIGDDDELNGVHCAWECRIIDADDKEDSNWIGLINNNPNNYKLEGNNTAIFVY